jgi:HMW1C N-terminal/HMW1 domain 2
MAVPNPASLDALELAVARRDRPAALTAAILILKACDDRYGRIDTIQVGALVADRPVERLATRFCAAFAQLICDPETQLTPVIYEQLTMHHRWIELMFSCSGFGSSGHLVPLLATGEGAAKQVSLENLKRFLVLFASSAGMNINLEEAMTADGATAMGGFLGILGTRFCFTENGHAFRERLLEWLPGRLNSVKLGMIALQTIASPYMHCSYAMTPRKHDIKADFIAQMRRACLEAGCPEYDPAKPRKAARKPTIVVATENFSFGHSVYRTHSRAVRALKEKYHVVGLGYQHQLTADVQTCFDEVIFYPANVSFVDAVKGLAAEILKRDTVMMFHLGVGMAPYVIALASLRLAPVQAASFGHTATTRSPVIDYMILPEDFVGDPACFSEELALVPPEAMSYEPRDDVDYKAVVAAADAEKATRPEGGPVRIAVAASAMKLGPPFFNALARINQAAKSKIEFQVFPLGCSGLGYVELKRRLERPLSNAIVHEETPYGPYMARLAACDFFICPFPYGNMNSIIDAVLLGLPGVCLDGPEAHAHADVAYFNRMGFPKGLATSNLDDYVAAVARLADDPKWLARCRKAVRGVNLDKVFFTGDESLFVAKVDELLAGGHGAAKTRELAEAT